MNNEDLVLKMILDESGFKAGLDGAVKKLGDFDGQVSNTSQKGGKSLGGIWTSFVGNFLASGATKIISTGIGMITGSIDNAINRVDTLNNSNRVFENMGFKIDEVDNAMGALTKSITGLPTPMDSAIQGLQLIASSTNDLGKSEKIFSALNNGILGFGGSTEMVQNAIIQLSQAFSNGKVDASTWNSMINSGLGPALNALAKQAGLTAGEFKEGLSDGSISVEEFQDALIKLNEEGGGGLKSLSQIAQDSTSGIKTGLSNMKTAITRGMANLITAIDESLQDAGFGGISDIIAGIGSSFEKGLTTVANNLPQIIAGFSKFVDIVKTLTPFLVPLATAFGAFMFQLKGIPTIIKTFNNMKTAIAGVGKSLKIMGAIAAANPITLLVGAVVGAIAVFGYFMATNKEFRDTVIGMWNNVKDAVVGTLTSIKDWGLETWGAMKQWASDAVDGVKNAWSGTKQWFSDTWSGIKEESSQLWEGTKSSAKDAADGVKSAWNGTKQWFSDLWTGVKDGVKSAWDSMTTVFSEKANAIKAVIMGRFGPVVYNIRNIFDNTVGFLETLWNNMVNIASNSFELLKNVILAPVLFVVSMISGGWEEAKNNLIGVWNNISESASNIWGSIVAIFTGYFEMIWNNVQSVWGSIQFLLTSTWDNIVSTAAETWDGVKNYFTNLWNDIYFGVSSTWTDIKNYFTNLWNDIEVGTVEAWVSMEMFFFDTWESIKSTSKKAWEDFKSNLAKTWDDTKRGTKEAWNGIKKFFFDTVDSIVSGAQNAWTDLKNGVSDAVDKVKDFFNTLKEIDLLQIGKDIIQGLINGIGEKIGAVRDKIVGVADSIKNGLKGALGIHSPSRWARDMIGHNIPLGVVQGIEEEQSTLDAAVRRMADLPTDLPQVTVSRPAVTATSNQSTETNRNTNSNTDQRPIELHLHITNYGDDLPEMTALKWGRKIATVLTDLKNNDYAPQGGMA